MYIIYRWKVFFVMNMNSRSLPQNKAPIGSDPLAKSVVFVQKSVSTIWTLLSVMEGTILKKRSR